MQESQIILQLPPYNNCYVELKKLSGHTYYQSLKSDNVSL